MLKHTKEVFKEVRALSAYTAFSLVGALIKLPPSSVGRRRPVVLVPGFLGRGLAFHRLRRRLAKKGHPVYVADLGYGVGCIEEKARLLEEFIDAHELDDFYVLGHSMGGTIALAMSEAYRQRVRHFFTTGTAFHGAVLSYLVPVFPAARQLNPRSAVLQKVLKNASRHKNLTNIVPRWDEIAFPLRVCRIRGACREITGVGGHVQLIMAPSALEQIATLLDELEAPSSAPAKDRPEQKKTLST